MSEYTDKNNILIRDKPLDECEYVDVNWSNRIFYVPHENGNGFTFKGLQATQTIHEEGVEDSSAFNYSDVKCLVTLKGIAYFDGIRHLYMGSEKTNNLGYLYYQRKEELKNIITKLQELEKKYCKESI